MGRNILQSSLKYAYLGIIFQVLFRCITFILNAYNVRKLSKDVHGIINVRLLLLESTILFLSKEPLLKACLSNTKSHNWAQVINLIWVTIPISSLLSICAVYYWLNMLSPVDDILYTQYKWCCYSIALSCVLEQCTQSVVLVVQSFSFFTLKLILDLLHILTRTFIFFCLVEYDPDTAIGAFAIAQIISVFVLCFSYFLFFAWYIPNLKMHHKKELKDSKLFNDMKDFPFNSVLDFFPGMMKNEKSLLNKDLCLLTVSFFGQSIVKQLLTDGEKYVMTMMAVMTFAQQSMYDIANNLGSLVARLIFRPIEESAYFYFTQKVQREVPVKKQNKESISESASVLKQLCNVMVSFGLVVFVFGQSYSYSLLYLYGGQNLVDDVLPVTLLRFHSFAIILLAVNGVTEAFVFATMSKKQLHWYNLVLSLFSVIFLIVSYVLTIRLGPEGFIIANCINMLLRVLYSFYYIWNMYKNSAYKPLHGLIPRWKFIGVLLISLYSTKLSEGLLLAKETLLLSSIFAHIFVGSIFFFLTLIVWALDNEEILRIGYDKLKKKQSNK